MKLPIYQIDAFTSRLFGGNPAAVVPLDKWLADEVLQAIAAENNLSETAFVIPQPNLCKLRLFTPVLEMDLCGHATLAAAHVMFGEYFPAQREVTFETRSGRLNVVRSGDLLVMEFPSRPGKPVQVCDDFISALGQRPREALQARDLLLVFDSEDEVRAMRPNFERVAMLDTFAVIVSAPGSEADFVSRFFAPKAGVAEDPVTGSAHCTLIPPPGHQSPRARRAARIAVRPHAAIVGVRAEFACPGARPNMSSTCAARSKWSNRATRVGARTVAM